ncbi:MAG: nucleotidyl transferase AbiEii/AbiGii toxin family protein [Bacteroidota bacterium]
MLHKETVAPKTLALIKTLQSDNYFDDFYLVDGTGLSLQIGHRISVDIDFFTRNNFKPQEFMEHLEKKFGFILQYMHHNTLKGFIGNVLLDILRHDYTFVKEPVCSEGINLLSKEDIAAMKVNAICGNGTRAKDFVDIYFLLKDFSFEQLISFYSIKYGSRNEFHAIKSLTYFNDIVAEDWPNVISDKKLTINKVKQTITKHRNLFLNSKIR